MNKVALILAVIVIIVMLGVIGGKMASEYVDSKNNNEVNEVNQLIDKAK